jgi:hypothetical protein
MLYVSFTSKNLVAIALACGVTSLGYFFIIIYFLRYRIIFEFPPPIIDDDIFILLMLIYNYLLS